MTRLLVLAAAVLASLGCDPGCKKIWRVSKYEPSPASATIEGGRLMLRTTLGTFDEEHNIGLSQPFAAGDFQASLRFEGFRSGDGGGLNLGTGAGGAVATAGVTKLLNLNMLVAAAFPGPTPGGDTKETGSPAGVLAIQRAGPTVTVTAEAGQQRARFSTDAFGAGTGQLVIGLGVGAKADSSGDVSVDVTSFSGSGAGLTSDDFRCDSLF